MGSDSPKEEKHFVYPKNMNNIPNNQIQNHNQNPVNDTNNKTKNIKSSLKYNDEELMRKLKFFIDEVNIQDLIFNNKKSLTDSVFDAINKIEKEKLIKYLSQIKGEFINVILDYLQSSNINISPNLISNIIHKENGVDIYQQKIMKEIKKINEDENSFRINNLTIMLIGKSGVGKSTLINSLLQLKGDKMAQARPGLPTTLEITPYTSDEVPFLRLIDTRGIELNFKFGAKEITQVCQAFITAQLHQNDMNKFVHCIWYCVTGSRFEEVEIECINILKNSYQNSKIPIIIVYTQATNVKLIQEMEIYIKKTQIRDEFVKILALEIELPGGQFLKSFGLDELLKKTINVCKKALSGELHSVMTSNINNSIENILKKENSKIKKLVKEDNILNFIDTYNIKNVGDFQNYLTNIYGTNIRYYLEKESTRGGQDLFKSSNLILEHNNNYIKYYENKANNMIDSNIESLSYKSLATQAEIEKKLGKPTLMENKRDFNDFYLTNKKFLQDNLFFIAQKYYMFYIFHNTCENISNIFNESFDNIVHDLLNQSFCKEQISKLFLKRFNDFELKIAKKNLIKNVVKEEFINLENNNQNNHIDSNNIKKSPPKDYKENGMNQNIINNNKEQYTIKENFINDKNSRFSKSNAIMSNNNSNISSNKFLSTSSNSNYNNNKGNININQIKEFSDLKSVSTIPIDILSNNQNKLKNNNQINIQNKIIDNQNIINDNYNKMSITNSNQKRSIVNNNNNYNTLSNNYINKKSINNNYNTLPNNSYINQKSIYKNNSNIISNNSLNNYNTISNNTDNQNHHHHHHQNNYNIISNNSIHKSILKNSTYVINPNQQVFNQANSKYYNDYNRQMQKKINKYYQYVPKINQSNIYNN